MKIGIVLLIEGNESFGIPRYREVRAMAQQAEGVGFDSVWLYDHLLFRGGESTVGQWECFTFLSALAEATERVEIGTLVACTAFRNPAMLAKMATALDEVSNGRFTLGLGAGWNEAEFHAFGLPFDHRVDRFEEALQVIVPLVRTGRVDFVGAYAQAPDCEDLPRGPRPNGPPILIGAFGPRMLNLAARYADDVNTAYSPENREILEAACIEHGRDPATLSVSTPAWMAFPDLGPTPDHMKESQYHTADDVVAELRKLEQAGIDHVMIDFQPNTAATLAILSEALEDYRS